MTKNDVYAMSKIYYSRNHQKFRGATEWIIRHATVSRGDVLCLEKQVHRLNSNYMIGNMVSRDFVAKYAAQLFPQVAAQRMQIFAQIWKSIAVEQKRWQKD
jgi:hypothetical protein